MDSVLIANRGEIAIRVMRAASELDIRTIAVFSQDDAGSLHVRRADEAVALRGIGARAYLDAEQLVAIARAQGCDAIHPGYGFLSEDARFATLCEREGIRFVGPRSELLSLFGDKARARALAEQHGVPVLRGTNAATSLEEAEHFFDALEDGQAMVIKALAGGGGRGMRVVERAQDVASLYERCRSEAASAFGREEVYVEALIAKARHIEVQIIGDGSGAVSHLHERDCTLQRRHQKLVEVAPSPGLAGLLRESIIAAAVRMAEAERYESLGTFEFLVDESGGAGERDDAYAFIEANARLQVEHTVTEEITGVDLVRAQLQISRGDSLQSLGLTQADIPEPDGFAIQARVNMESLGPSGQTLPSSGTLTIFEIPSGPGLRTDTAGYAGLTSNPHFDSLLAKLVAHARAGSYEEALRRAYRGLCEFKIEGIETNIALLQDLLMHPDVVANRVHTRFVDAHAAAFGREPHRSLFFEAAAGGSDSSLAGARIDSNDPLAVLAHGKSAARINQPVEPPANAPESQPSAPAGAIVAPMQGTIVSVEVCEGEAVYAGQTVVILEAMKMEHVLAAEQAGVVRAIRVAVGDAVREGAALVVVEPGEGAQALAEEAREIDPDRVRPDLAEVHDRHALLCDEARPAAVARRRKTGQRTARENVEDLCDEGSFVEYGSLMIAAQRRRRSVEDLIENTPADGLVGGIGSVNASLFEADESAEETRCRTVVMSYDYTVLAGTQGAQNHRKKDRMFELAERWRLPVVFFTEGGGGRPGDTDALGVAGLDCMAFNLYGRLSGLVPLVGIVSGRCFAGNAALLGCCDVVIATEGANIGMGGPAMIEGGGLGIYRPEEVGPLPVQVANGVVDVPVADEAAAVAVAKKYLSYFQGRTREWTCADQRMLRAIIPENRRRIYDVRSVLETLVDTDSLLELRRSFGPGMVTSLARIEGRPIGIVANDPAHLAGAIDSDGADKASRFMQLCDAFDIPLLFLCDTPGIMVGPEVEETALVRHASRMFVTGASLSVPFFTIILRKAYGLGAQAMAGGSFKAPIFTISWPTGEFGGMGLEGAVKLGFRKELEAEQDPVKRKALFDEMVERMYAHGKAVNTASHFEIDDVIDPLESRGWITRTLDAVPEPPLRTGKKRPCIDTW